MTLLEGLVAFLVLSVGMLTIVRVQSQLRLNSDIARQRSEAVRLAQQEIEGLRSFAALDGGGASYAGIADGESTVDAAGGYVSNTSYAVVRRVGRNDPSGRKSARVTVSWRDRGGTLQEVVLSSIIAANDPALAAALALPPQGMPVRGARGRSAYIPLRAVDLGDGRSAHRAGPAGPILVFDNLTGRVVGRCSTSASASAPLVPADARDCTPESGFLISGTVRFALGSPPDPLHANDLPLPLNMALMPRGSSLASSATCTAQAVKTVAYLGAAGLQFEDVALDASPALRGLTSWDDTGERFTAYQCLVHAAAGLWSGSSTVVPVGWSLGTSPAAFRVCRYVSDSDGSGTIDLNSEHPATYTDVPGPLANQNFLVVAGSQSCPAGPADSPSLATVQHQP